jgi:hypothetical protein
MIGAYESYNLSDAIFPCAASRPESTWDKVQPGDQSANTIETCRCAAEKTELPDCVRNSATARLPDDSGRYFPRRLRTESRDTQPNAVDWPSFRGIALQGLNCIAHLAPQPPRLDCQCRECLLRVSCALERHAGVLSIRVAFGSEKAFEENSIAYRARTCVTRTSVQ